MIKGSLHPLTQIVRTAFSALGDMGFDIVDAPEIDTAWYNFDALRMPPSHPARQGHPSFWLTNGKLLRTHPTNMQLHATETLRPPLRVMHYGNCYRDDATDQTHDVMFSQIDILAIDEGLNLGHLLWVLDTFVTRMFGPDVTYRFRPHAFPFTEPSVEVDIFHNGRWIELLGSGMVHPDVIKNMGLDPEKYSGFAFGLGVERLALFKWGLEDIRDLRSNKIAFLRQFKEASA